jgi:hypothetical protein
VNTLTDSRSGGAGVVGEAQDLVVGDAVDALEVAAEVVAAGGDGDAADAEQAGHGSDEGLEGEAVDRHAEGDAVGVEVAPGSPASTSSTATRMQAARGRAGPDSLVSR